MTTAATSDRLIAMDEILGTYRVRLAKVQAITADPDSYVLSTEDNILFVRSAPATAERGPHYRLSGLEFAEVWPTTRTAHQIMNRWNGNARGNPSVHVHVVNHVLARQLVISGLQSSIRGLEMAKEAILAGANA